MSAPVDVLAVMDAAARAMDTPVSTAGARQLNAARAASAELIAAGDRLTAAFRALGLDNSLVNRSQLARECEEALVAFDTALARVKGCAA